MAASLVGTPALAGQGDCASSSDAPSMYVANCNGVCSFASNQWTCDLRNLCTVGGDAYPVASYGAGFHDYVAFGVCFGVTDTPFCCTYDEDTAGEVDQIELHGTAYNDDGLNFVYDHDFDTDIEEAGTENLFAICEELNAYIYAHAGDDGVHGSNYNGVDYREYLSGNAGNDTIYGNDDRDWLYGGDGNDTLYGGQNSDILHGGDGNDTLDGEAGDDYLCDQTGTVVGKCATNGTGGNKFIGGNGTDIAWYDEDPDCTGRALDPASSMGADSDTCGDANDWTTEFPLYCEDTTLVTEPTECAP